MSASPSASSVKPKTEEKPAVAPPVSREPVTSVPEKPVSPAVPPVSADPKKIPPADDVKLKGPAPVKNKRPKEARPFPYPYFHLGLGLVLTALFLGGTFFLKKQLVAFALKSRQTRTQIASLTEKEAGFGRLTESFAAIQPEAEALAKAFPTEGQMVGFVKDLKKISASLTVENFSFVTDEPEKDKAGRLFVDFGLEATGPLPGLETFLHDLVSLPYLIKLQAADLRLREKGEPKLIISATLFVNQSFFGE